MTQTRKFGAVPPQGRDAMLESKVAFLRKCLGCLYNGMSKGDWSEVDAEIMEEAISAGKMVDQAVRQRQIAEKSHAIRVTTPALREQLDGLEPTDTIAVMGIVHTQVPLAQAAEVYLTVVDRVSQKTGEKPSDVQYFEFLGAFTLKASRRFVETLCHQLELCNVSPA